MKKREIVLELHLSEEEQARCETHSLCNVLSVIAAELQTMRLILRDREVFRLPLDRIQEVARSLGDAAHLRELLESFDSFRASVLEEFRRVTSALAGGGEHQVHLSAAEENLNNIFKVAEVRVREMLARIGRGGAWERFAPAGVEAGLREVLDAIAKNARHRFRIAYDPAAQKPGDYLVELSVRGLTPDAIVMPPVLVDNLRDLTANARKYTDPGGRISARLEETERELVLEVRDTGRGIPEAEFDEVVRFGVRGSNTRIYETRGMGFGLTKAYFVAKQYGGRMWIESGENEGTVITIVIPKR